MTVFTSGGVVATSGTPQSTAIGSAFLNALLVTVEDANGNPVPNVSVTFTAPASGASGLFSNGSTTITATTDANGQLSESFTANANGGNYSVTAAVNGVNAPASFILTNLAGPAGTVANDTPTFAWLPVAGAKYYVLKVTDKSTNRLVLNLTKLAGPIYTLTSAQALTPGHHYTWTAQGVTSNNQTVTSASNVAFNVAALGVPVPSGPIGPIATDMPTFTWTPSSNANVTPAASYTLKITDKTTGKILTIAKLAGTSYTLTTAQALTPSNTFAWTVTAVSTNDLASAKASAPDTFTVDPIGAPTPNGPTGAQTTDMPTFTWTPSGNANVTPPASYTLKITDTTTHKVLTIAKLTGASYTLTAGQALTPGDSFAWTVTAVSTNGLATIASTEPDLHNRQLDRPFARLSRRRQSADVHLATRHGRQHLRFQDC